MSKDYYQILGILDSAEDVVIRASYKALAQRYHPDKWRGSKEDANLRMAEINEAYSTLSDPQKKSKYDSTRESFKYKSDLKTETVAKESSDFLDAINKDWAIAKNQYPGIDVNFIHLEKFSYLLAFSYKLILLDTKLFNEYQSIFFRLKDSFLKAYFGEMKSIVNFAEELILENNLEAAKELNDHVRVLGKSLLEEKVIKDISSKYQTQRYLKNQSRIEEDKKAEAYMDKVFNLGGKILILVIILSMSFFYLSAINFISSLLIIGGIYGGYYLLKGNKKNNFAGITCCPRCNSKFKVPIGKHIQVRCKNCTHTWRTKT